MFCGISSELLVKFKEKIKLKKVRTGFEINIDFNPVFVSQICASLLSKTLKIINFHSILN